MNGGALLIVLVVLMLVASVPVVPWAKTWGYIPSVAMAVLLVVVVVLVWAGRLG